MKKTASLLLVLLLFLGTVSLQAQEYKFLPKKSHKLTPEELKGVRISPTIPSYTIEGIKLDQMQTMKMMSSPAMSMEFYGDKAGDIVAIVFKEASKEQMEAKLYAMSQGMGEGEWFGEAAPEFIALDMDLEKFKLSDHKGSVVALNFWFIGCKPCIMEMPELNDLVAKYKDHNIKFIAVALDDRNKLIPFLQRTEFDYNVFPEARSVSSIFNVSGYPTHILIDQDGVVQFSQTGYNGALSAVLDSKIEALLEKGDN